jgi:hypothetical protein
VSDKRLEALDGAYAAHVASIFEVLCVSLGSGTGDTAKMAPERFRRALANADRARAIAAEAMENK